MSALSTTDSLVIVGGETSEIDEETNVEPHSPKMQSMRVVSNVRNRYASTVVTSKYVNLNSRALQATFSIVLPDTAFIAEFVMEIEGKKYEAFVREKEEAKQVYQEAVRSDQAAAHVAVSARDSNKFTVSVNVEPQSNVIFILTYEELLVRKHGKYEIVINLHPGQLLDELGVDVHINETRPIIHVETPAIRSGHEIDDKVKKNDHATIIQDDDDGVVHVSFHPTVEQQKEMAKALSNKDEKTETFEQLPNENEITGISGQFVVEYDVDRDPQGGDVLVNDGYFVHFFAPSDLKPIPKHVIFVLDVSGSMSGRKLKQLKEAMKVILNELNPEDYFNLVKFSDDISVLNSKYTWNTIDIPAESMLPESFAVNAKNIKSIQNVVDHISDVGMTNIYDALIVGLRMTSKRISHSEKIKNKHRPQPMIVFLTDGQPNVSESDPKKIIEMVENRNDCDNKCAVFTLAFGDDADNEFLKELAVKNSGFLRNIYEAADASLQLQDFYKQISSPLLTNINFKYSEDVKDVTKQTFDILFDGSEFVVAGKVDDMVDGFVFVEGSTIDGTSKFCPNIKEEYGNLERLWAYMTIKQLLDEKYENKTSDKNQPEEKTTTQQNEMAEKEALKLALKYSFVTPITSLVVVKPDESYVVEQLQKSNEQSDNLSVTKCCQMGFFVKQDYCSLYPDYENSMDYGSVYNRSLEYAISKMANDISSSSSTMDKIPEKKKSISLSSGFRTLKQHLKIKPKDDNACEQILLKSIDVECKVKNHFATTKERRKYLNFDDKPQETTFTIVLPDKAIVTEFHIYTEAQQFVAEGRGKKQAKKQFKEAVYNGTNAALVNLHNSNKAIITVHIMPQNEVTFVLTYSKCLEYKAGKYEIGINLHREAQTEEIKVNVNIIEATRITNVATLPLRSNYEVMNNEYVTTDRTNDNEAHVEFCATAEQQEEIAAVLKSKDGIFTGEFIVEYEVEPDPSSAMDAVTNAPVPVSFQYLIAIKSNN